MAIKLNRSVFLAVECRSKMSDVVGFWSVSLPPYLPKIEFYTTLLKTKQTSGRT